MSTIADIRDYLDGLAPFSTQMGYDNAGLLVGFPDREARRVLTALDITDEVISEAVRLEAELIVSHHPLIWEPLKQVLNDDPKGRKVIALARHGISALCLHTNLDATGGGVNDALMAALGGKVTGLLAPHGIYPDGKPCGIARIGELDEAMDFFAFLEKVKGNLKANGLRYVYCGKPVYRLACCGGSGGADMQKASAAGCDTYVTADLKYDHFLWAKEAGLNLVDAGHFSTENVVVPVLAGWLKEGFPSLEVCISQVHGQVDRYY